MYREETSGIREDPRRHPAGVPASVELISHPFRVQTNRMIGSGGLTTTGYYLAALRAAPPHFPRRSQISDYLQLQR